MLQIALLFHEEHDVTQVYPLGPGSGRYGGRAAPGPAAPAAGFTVLVEFELFTLGADGCQGGGVRLRVSEIIRKFFTIMCWYLIIFCINHI